MNEPRKHRLSPRERATHGKCPVCGVYPGIQCEGAAVHVERLQAAPHFVWQHAHGCAAYAHKSFLPELCTCGATQKNKEKT